MNATKWLQSINDFKKLRYKIDKVIQVIDKVTWQLAKLIFATFSGANCHFFQSRSFITQGHSIVFFNQDNWQANLTTCKMTIYTCHHFSVSHILNVKEKLGLQQQIFPIFSMYKTFWWSLLWFLIFRNLYCQIIMRLRWPINIHFILKRMQSLISWLVIILCHFI